MNSGVFHYLRLYTIALTMDPYDSDSSVDEDFTDTGVLLGYSTEEVIEDIVSHLGGLPVGLIHGDTTTIRPLIS